MNRFFTLATALGGAGLATLALVDPALAQDAAAPVPNKGDTAWMLVAAVLVLLMVVPGLALFYGGLVRTKNMLSVLMQVLTIVCVAALVWFCWGYSMAFTSTGTPFPKLFGGLDKAFLAGVDPTTLAATFSNGVYLPEYVFVIFQMTFACITPALIVPLVDGVQATGMARRSSGRGAVMRALERTIDQPRPNSKPSARTLDRQ